MAGTVTATEGGSTTNGISLRVVVLTGQNASPIGVQQQASGSTTQSIATGTGVTTGSWAYASVLGLTTITANGSTTFQANNNSGGIQYVAARSTSTLTGGVSATIGGTGGTGISICLQEILAGAGLAEDASTPANVFQAAAITCTTASFTPPAGSLLVAVVSSNGAGGVTTMTVSDTGLGLTWTQQVHQNGAGNGYSGIWTAPVASGNASVSGVAATMALAAPAGSLEVDTGITGLVSALALAAPAGTTAVNPVPGVAAALALAAIPGTVTAASGGGQGGPPDASRSSYRRRLLW